MRFHLTPDGTGEPDPAEEREEYRRRARSRAHCPTCGRFARYIRGYWEYLGYGSEYRVEVRCSTHGLQAIY